MNLPYISLPYEISNSEYHTGERFKDFISSSVLKQIAISPKWLKYCQDNPEDERLTAAWKLEGGCYHDILSSICNTGGMDEFNNNCAIFDPPVNKGTGKPFGYESVKFIDAFTMAQEDNPDKELYSTKEIDLSKAMIKELTEGNPHLSPIIRRFLKIGTAEVSTFVKHKANDLIQYDIGMFKTRKDLFTDNKIIDWKSVGVGKGGGRPPIKSDEFARVIESRLYGFSAAMYQYIDWMVTGKWRSFYWVVQEKQPPYDFNIISADGWAFEVNRGEMVGIGTHANMFIRAMEAYLYCVEKNVWNGVSIFTKADYKGQRIAESKVPGWLKNRDFEYYF